MASKPSKGNAGKANVAQPRQGHKSTPAAPAKGQIHFGKNHGGTSGMGKGC